MSCHHACCTDSYTYTSSHQPKVQDMCSRSGHQSSFGFMAHPKQVLRSSCRQGMHALSCFSLPSTGRCLVDTIYCRSSSHVSPLKPSDCTYHTVGACNICLCRFYTLHARTLIHAMQRWSDEMLWLDEPPGWNFHRVSNFH